LTHYPVLTLAAVSVFGFILATVVLVAGFVWLAVVVFAATTLILCWLIAIWAGRSAK
jgi:membrane protein implicated in regulation of membrane protease activity